MTTQTGQARKLTIQQLKEMRDAASIPPERASYLAMSGQLSQAQAREIGSIAAAYVFAGKRTMGTPGLLNPTILLAQCFQVLTGQEVTY